MFNSRLSTLLVLIVCVISPLAFYWATASDANWYRPYILWLLIIAAIRFRQRHSDSTE